MTLGLAAENLDFIPKDFSVPAGSPLRIAFTNRDATVDHSVAIRNAGGSTVFAGAIVTGVASRTYSVPALKAGTYTFYCTVHSFMTGTITVH